MISVNCNRQRACLAGDRQRQQQELTAIERRIASLVDSIADGLDSCHPGSTG